MLDILGPDDLGQLTFIPRYTKCLNLNPIMPSVLGPGGLSQLILIPSYTKYLKLDPIMPSVLEPDDLDKLALILSFCKYVSLNFSISLEIPIRVYCIYCYAVTTEDTYSIYVLTHVLNLFG